MAEWAVITLILVTLVILCVGGLVFHQGRCPGS
jgi:hypothetical protein